MPVLDRPSPQELDQVVREILDTGNEYEFRELEEQVQGRLPNLANPLQVRQAAWRLVRSNAAEVTGELRVKKGA